MFVIIPFYRKESSTISALYPSNANYIFSVSNGKTLTLATVELRGFFSNSNNIFSYYFFFNFILFYFILILFSCLFCFILFYFLSSFFN
jgi:hypothetical protein